MLKKILKAIAILLVVILLVVGGYLVYVFLSYHRLPDTSESFPMTGEAARTGEPYDIITWNLGFGAYSADYSFFMDGGTESRARSGAEAYDNIAHAIGVLQSENPQFMLLQELDIDATRSYHQNEAAQVSGAMPDYQACLAQNYDSPYLFYPLTRPHGASKSGILTLSRPAILRFQRKALPIEDGFMKFLDLDRCYSVSRIPVDNGKELVLYNLHLSAYTSDGTIATEQLELLTADMLSEYQAGNYCVAGGDFNKDLLGNSGEVFGVPGDAFTWAQPLKEGAIPEGLALVNSLDQENPVPSCRNADSAYEPGKSFVLTVDGFIVSDNVNVSDCHVIDEGFACSDHNPVKMTFTLNE